MKQKGLSAFQSAMRNTNQDASSSMGQGGYWKWFRSIPRMLLMGMVRAYQLVLSPHLPASCRFTPSCSEYALVALKEYGAVKGMVLTAWRVLRCNPFNRGGYDPPRWFGEAPIEFPLEGGYWVNDHPGDSSRDGGEVLLKGKGETKDTRIHGNS